jgi:glycine cleavage system H lipoate-binding protein
MDDRDMVEIESVKFVGLAPGVTVGEEKDAEAPAGKPDAVKVTGFVYAPLEGAMVRE